MDSLEKNLEGGSLGILLTICISLDRVSSSNCTRDLLPIKKGFIMPPKMSTQVSNALLLSTETNTAFSAYGVELSDALVGELKVCLQDNEIPDVKGFFDALQKLMLYRADETKKADQLVVGEESDDEDAYELRNAATDEGYEFLVDIKLNLKGSYGKGILTKLHLAGETPSDTNSVERTLSTLETLLRGKTEEDQTGTPFVFPPKKRKSSPGIDPIVLADDCKHYLQAIRKAQSAVGKDVRETQSAKIKRREQLESLRHVVRVNRVLLENVAALVKKFEISERINRKKPAPSTPAKAETPSEEEK